MAGTCCWSKECPVWDIFWPWEDLRWYIFKHVNYVYIEKKVIFSLCNGYTVLICNVKHDNYFGLQANLIILFPLFKTLEIANRLLNKHYFSDFRESWEVRPYYKKEICSFHSEHSDHFKASFYIDGDFFWLIYCFKFSDFRISLWRIKCRHFFSLEVGCKWLSQGITIENRLSFPVSLSKADRSLPLSIASLSLCICKRMMHGKDLKLFRYRPIPDPIL